VAVLGISGVLVAFQTQELKQSYFVYEGDARSLAVMTNSGALNFFIMFYNMFTILMSLLSRD
jgi:FtsH-binding integral membrane protein